MAYRLRTGLTFCTIGESSIFLDIPGNRYFQLGPVLNHIFQKYAAPAELSLHEWTSLAQAGVFETSDAPTPWQSDLPIPPRRSSRAIMQADCTAFDIASALLGLHWARRRLAKSPLSSELSLLKRVVGNLPVSAPDVQSPAGSIIRAYEQSKVLKSPADLCLPRSIALVRSLAKVRVRARLVLGVKVAPFAAHAWVQANDDILNDTLEEVAKYTPIYAL